MFRCRFFCAVISRDFRNLRLLPLFSSFPFFPLFRIVLRRESERLKAVRFISMLIYICIFSRFFQHFRDFYFLPPTSRVRVSLHPLFLCKIQKATIFLSFSFSSTLSLSPYLSLVLYPPLPHYSLLSPASFLLNSVNTWWILRYYFFFTCTGRFSVIADSFESRSFGEVQLPTSFVLSQDRLILDRRNRENPLVSRRYVGQ